MRGMLRKKLNDKYREIRKAFVSLDEDHSGYIDRSEIVDIIRHFQLPIPREHIETVVDSMDENNDGRISYAEFATAMQQIENDGVGVCW